MNTLTESELQRLVILVNNANSAHISFEQRGVIRQKLKDIIEMRTANENLLAVLRDKTKVAAITEEIKNIEIKRSERCP